MKSASSDRRLSIVRIQVLLLDDDCGCADPNVGARVGVASVRTECLLLLMHVYKVCLLYFFAFTANLHFICVFTSAFPCSHLPPIRLRLGGLSFELSK